MAPDSIERLKASA